MFCLYPPFSFCVTRKKYRKQKNDNYTNDAAKEKINERKRMNQEAKGK